MPKKLLIADDNRDIVEILDLYAKKEGYETVLAYDGEEVIKLAREAQPDMILLDVMIPKISGLDACRQIRQNSNVPIIMVTAKSEEADRILGLDIGADDYVTKPFSPREVMTRVRAVLRRVADPASDGQRRLDIDGLCLNMDGYECTIDGEQAPLTKKEMEILWVFANNPGRVFTRDQLLETIWGLEYTGDTRTVDTHIKRIRTKLGLGDASRFDIRTVWGVGYKFEFASKKEQE